VSSSGIRGTDGRTYYSDGKNITIKDSSGKIVYSDLATPKTPTGYTTTVTLPNGNKVTGYINNGVTTLADGSRPPVGSLVETAGGTYKMTSSGGVLVSNTNTNTNINTIPTSLATPKTPTGYTTTVTLPNGTKVTGYINNGVTTLADGSRPPVGSLVDTAGGTYKMTSSGGVLVSNTASKTPTGYTTTVTLPNGTKVTGYINNGVTTLADGSRPPVGSLVETANGVYKMTSSGGVPVAVNTTINSAPVPSGITLEQVSRNYGLITNYNPQTNMVTVTNPANNKTISFVSGQGQEYGLGGLYDDRNWVTDVDAFLRSLGIGEQQPEQLPPEIPEVDWQAYVDAFLRSLGIEEQQPEQLPPEIPEVDWQAYVDAILRDMLMEMQQPYPALPQMDIAQYISLIDQYAQQNGLTYEQALQQAMLLMQPQQRAALQQLMNAYREQLELLPYQLAQRSLLDSGMYEGGLANLTEAQARAIDASNQAAAQTASQIAQNLMSNDAARRDAEFNKRLALEQLMAANRENLYNNAMRIRQDKLQNLINLLSIINTQRSMDADQLARLMEWYGTMGLIGNDDAHNFVDTQLANVLRALGGA